LTTAACGGLRSAPDCRTRRVLLHLSYSCASPFGPALLVTQDPMQTFARLQGCKRRSRNCLALQPIRGPVGKYRATDILVTCRHSRCVAGSTAHLTRSPGQSSFTPQNLTTLAHLAVSSAMNLAKSAVELANAVKPTSESLDSTFRSERAAFLCARFSATAARANGSFP